MNGKVCLVTGANAGIGQATALGLAQLGATVIMVCRSRERGGIDGSELIVRGHHGGIHVSSEPGQGSTFKLLFPPPEAEQLPQSQASPPAVTAE